MGVFLEEHANGTLIFRWTPGHTYQRRKHQHLFEDK